MEGSRVPSWSQNRSKIDSRRYLKQDKVLNRFWVGLGSILGRFWRPSWEQVGTKIGPKVIWKRYQKMIKQNVEKSHTKLCRVVQGCAELCRNGGGSPCRRPSSLPTDRHGHYITPLVPQGARWRIYIYIYIYIFRSHFGSSFGKPE